MKSDIIDQLFSQYYNEALLYSISLCKNRTLAEDIVSNAFFKALGMADDSIRDFKPWLLTVCRNEFISLCRKESRFTGEDIPEDYVDDREEVIEGIIRKEEYRSLYRAIDLLPNTQREAVMLFYFSGLPIKSISEIIGKSETNTKLWMLYRKGILHIRSPISISGKSIGEVDKIVQFANGQIYPINAKRPQEFAASQGLLGIQMCD